MRCDACGRDEPARVEGTALLRCPGCRALFNEPGQRVTILPRDAAERAAPSVKLPAELADRFELGRVLGRGGMAIVYHARERGGHAEFAIKFLEIKSEDVRARFLQEGLLQLDIDHPHVAKVHALGEADGYPYLVCEYLPGGTLRQRIAERGRLSADEVLALVPPLFSALGALHARGIVHRDVKPENILFDAAGDLRLVDLGVARDVKRANQLTEAGTVLGTPSYMSPEQLLGEEATPAADLFAAGVTIYEALTGRLPFEGSNLQKVRGKEITYPAGMEPPADLAALMTRLLALEPARRPASAGECAAAAAAMREGAGRRVAATPPGIAAPVRRGEPTPLKRAAAPREATGPRLLGYAALGLALGIAAAVVALSRRAPEAPRVVESPRAPSAPRVLARDVRGDAVDLAGRLERLDVGRLVARIIRDPLARAPRGHWKRMANQELELANLRAPLEWFRAVAMRYWVAEDVPLPEKWRLYEALLRLEHVDGAIAVRGDPDALGLSALRQPFVEGTWRLIDRPAPADGSRELFPTVTCWMTEDFTGWDMLMLWRLQRHAWLDRLGAPPPGGYDSRSSYRHRRSLRALSLPAPGARGRVGVRALAVPGAGYHYDLTLTARQGGAVRLRVRHPGTEDWLQLANQTMQVKDESAATAPWGEIRVTVPRAALPEGPFDLEIAFDHLPGVHIRELDTIQRAGILSRIALVGE